SARPPGPAPVLRPFALNGAGLAGGLEALARNVRHTYRASCTLAWDSRCPTLRDETAMHLMRIAQEAVRNAFARAGADRIHISVETVGGSGLLSIQDNGV